MSKKNRVASTDPTKSTGPIAPAASVPPVAPNTAAPTVPVTPPGTDSPSPATEVPTPLAAGETPTAKRYKKALDRAKEFDMETRQIERDHAKKLQDILNQRKEERKQILADKQKAFLEIDAEQRQTTLGIPTDPVVTGDAVTQPVAPITQRQPEVPSADQPQPVGDPLAPVPNAPTQPEAPLMQRRPEPGNPDQDAPLNNIGQEDEIPADDKKPAAEKTNP